jgi:hypothetical protein
MGWCRNPHNSKGSQVVSTPDQIFGAKFRYEIQNPSKRIGIIDFIRLTELPGFDTYEQLKNSHFKWIDSAIQDANIDREAKWSQSFIVGSEAYIK